MCYSFIRITELQENFGSREKIYKKICFHFIQGNSYKSSGISDLCGTVAGMDTTKGSMSTEGETLQFLSFLTGARYVHPWWNLITELTSAASPMVDISRTCNVGQKLGVSLPLLTCSPSACPSRLLYRRGRKSRRDLRITLYFMSLELTNLLGLDGCVC